MTSSPKPISIKDLELIFSLMKLHNITYLKYNDLEISASNKQLSLPIHEQPKESHTSLTPPQSDLDILYNGLKKGEFNP